MKNLKQLFAVCIMALLVASLCARSLSIVSGLSPLLSFACLAIGMFVLFLLPRPAHSKGVHAAGIYTEIWENHIVENLYKNNEFLSRSMDDSEYVNNLTVHLPQSGADPVITKNRNFSATPIAVTQRTDATVDYSIDEYTSAPVRIGNAEDVQSSYNKRESILFSHEQKLRQDISDNALVEWAPTAAITSNILRTTGVQYNNPANAVVFSVANVNSSATGNRLNFGTYDLRQAMLLLNNQNVPLNDRCVLMSANIYDQFLTDLTQTQYRDFSSTIDPKTGIVGKLWGFDIYMRSSVLTYTNDSTPLVKAVGAAGAATDNDTVLFWQTAAVRKAMGGVKFFEDLNSAVYQGDVYSLLCRFGGTKSRTTEIGVGAIVQGAHA